MILQCYEYSDTLQYTLADSQMCTARVMLSYKKVSDLRELYFCRSSMSDLGRDRSPQQL